MCLFSIGLIDELLQFRVLPKFKALGELLRREINFFNTLFFVTM